MFLTLDEVDDEGSLFFSAVVIDEDRQSDRTSGRA
jgi:hypothetical protein